MLSEKSIVSISPKMLTWQGGSIPGFPRVAAATPNTPYNCLLSSVISDPVTVVSADWWQSPTKHVNVMIRVFTLTWRGITASYGEEKRAIRFSTDDFHGFNGPTMARAIHWLLHRSLGTTPAVRPLSSPNGHCINKPGKPGKYKC